MSNTESASPRAGSTNRPLSTFAGLFAGCAAAGIAIASYWILAPFVVVLVIAVAWFTPHDGAVAFANGAFAALMGVLVFGVASLVLAAL